MCYLKKKEGKFWYKIRKNKIKIISFNFNLNEYNFLKI